MTWVSISLLLTSNSTLFQLSFLGMCLVQFSGSSEWADVYIWYISLQTSLFLSLHFFLLLARLLKETEWDTIFLQCLNCNVSNINESKNSWRKVIPGNRSMAWSCHECVIFSLHKKFYWLKKMINFSYNFFKFFIFSKLLFPFSLNFSSFSFNYPVRGNTNPIRITSLNLFKWQINMPRFH